MIKLLFAALFSVVLLSNTCHQTKKEQSEQPQVQSQTEQAQPKPVEESPVQVPEEPKAKPQPESNLNFETLKKLYAKYKNGEIEVCQYNGATVYKAGLNAPDAGSVIFDKDGNKIGTCNYGWGKPDKMCEELNSCEDVYRVANNIWDKPAVDKYNLGNK